MSSNYKILNSRGKEIFTNVTLHPGDILLEELEVREIKKTDFAKQLNMKGDHFNELLDAKRKINAAIALRLEGLLGISAEYWMRVQAYYDLFIAK